MLVNNNWEQIYDLSDVSRINRDLADELDKLIPVYTDEEYKILEVDLEVAEDNIRDLENEIDTLQNEIDQLQEQLNEYEQQ